MHKGIYIAISGAVLKQNQLEVIAQNLANANSIGYKREYITFSDYLIKESNKVSDDKIMTNLNRVYYDFSKGEFIRTGKILDIAIEGEGFIALEGNLYTRRGDLKVDDEGYLTNFKGIRVLGRDGLINVGKDKIPTITSTGRVIVDGNEIDEIKIVNFDSYEGLVKRDSSTFYTNQLGKDSNPSILTGYLETSNVSAINEMISMITALRDFESYQKAVQIFDESINKIINDIARL
jgi:flagellar basal-body rod protein FlgG